MGLRRASAIAVLSVVACAGGDGRQNTGTSIGVDDATSTATTSATGLDDASATGSDASATSSAGTTAVDGSSGGTSAETGAGTTGGPALPCDQDPASCDAWFLPRSADQWEAVTIGGPAALAPSSPILAAFDIEADRIAFVLTVDEVIEVDLEKRTWVAKTNVADRFPEIDVPVLSAYSVPAYWSGMQGTPEGVTIAGSDVAFLYDYAAGTFTYSLTSAFGAEWSAPDAPAGADVRAMWLDVTNADGWVDNDVSELCDSGSGPVGPYLAVVTSDHVHISDVGTCFAFFPGVPYAQFATMALEGAPPPDRVGGAAYNETTGLVVFAGE